MYQEFFRIGKLAWQQGLFSSHGGNMSVRVGEKILITRRGSMLGCLTERDIIETSLNENDSFITMASTEIIVHRSIYKETTALAIFHAHPPTAVALSFCGDSIVPVDSEGSYIIKKVPVIETKLTVGAKEVAQILPEYLKSFKIVMLKGHGTFAIGTLLEEAFSITSSLEHSAKIFTVMKNLGVSIDRDSLW